MGIFIMMFWAGFIFGGITGFVVGMIFGSMMSEAMENDVRRGTPRHWDF